MAHLVLIFFYEEFGGNTLKVTASEPFPDSTRSFGRIDLPGSRITLLIIPDGAANHTQGQIRIG